MAMPNSFDRIVDGKRVQLFELKNNSNTVLQLTNYGCRIVQLLVTDKNNSQVDVVFGYKTIEEYLQTKDVYHGVVIGRYANRIANGCFELNDTVFQLAKNVGGNNLHGGPGGFHTKVWEVDDASASSITFSYLSPGGEEGFPGNLQTTVTYQLTNKNEVVIRFKATSDADTVINLTNHAYFNLNGVTSGNVLQHRLQIAADYITPVNENIIPTGEWMPVQGTPFDFNKPVEIGDGIGSNHPQIQLARGYDHNFVLRNYNNQLNQVATAVGEASGLLMHVFTTEPGMQLYVTGERKLFCLETQHFPDSPNQPHFPSVVLREGEEFVSTTAYQFV